MRFALFGMSLLFLTGVAMCFELACYGLISGLLYALLPRRKSSIYAALLTAMLCGRLVWGAVRMLLFGVTGNAFTWMEFLSGAFTSAIPGIILYIALVPAIVMALERVLSWLKPGKQQ